MRKQILKATKFAIMFLCVFTMFTSSLTVVRAEFLQKKDTSPVKTVTGTPTASVDESVTLEVYNGKKWKETNGRKLKLYGSTQKAVSSVKADTTYHLDDLRLVNHTDQDLQYTIMIVQVRGTTSLKDTMEWSYVSEGQVNVIDEYKGVVLANETSEVFSIGAYLERTNANKNKNYKVESVDISVLTTPVEELRDAPYYAINTDVDLDIDEEGKTIVLKDTMQNYLASVNGEKITFSNATITGDTYAFSFGIYRGAAYATYNNEVNNVNFVDVNVGNGVLNGHDKVSNAVYSYGNSVYNNCNMTGTTSTAEGYNVYDIGFVNKSVSTINGGTYGSIYVWSQAHLTINDAEVDKIDCSTITTRNLGMLTIGAGTHVGTINLTTCGYTQYEPALTIERGAVVDEIIYRGKTYSQKEWNNPFYGKYISVMGDSISTYTGWSDVNPITDESCTNRYGEAYYGPAGGDFHNTDMLVDDTWWYQAAQELGGEILMSNAGNSTGVLYASYPSIPAWDLYLKEMLAWKSRPYYLGKDGKNPDIIALYIGSNEARNSKVINEQGSLEDTLNKNLVVKNEDGTYTYGTPVTFTDAYFVMMHKVSVTYPDAEVYCFIPVPQAGGTLTTINTRMKSTIAVKNAITEVADYYGAIKVDLIEAFDVDPDGDGTITQEDFDVFSTYFHNDPHPNASGFDVITECFVETVLENSKYNK